MNKMIHKPKVQFPKPCLHEWREMHLGRHYMSMKIVVISDSHGADDLLNCIIREERDAQYIIFLGDGERDLEEALAENDIALYDPSCRIKVLQVCGNCDLFSHEPALIIEEIDGVKVYIAHGFQEGVKYGISRLVQAAKDRGCGLALFGHTHRRHLSEEDGVICFNPGSVYSHSYGIVRIEHGEVRCEWADI